MSPGNTERARFSTAEIDRYYLTALRWGAIAFALWFAGNSVLWFWVLLPWLGWSPPAGRREVADILFRVVPLFCSGAITGRLSRQAIASLRHSWVALGLIGIVCQVPFVLIICMDILFYQTTGWSWRTPAVNLTIWSVGAFGVVLVSTWRQRRAHQPRAVP